MLLENSHFGRSVDYNQLLFGMNFFKNRHVVAAMIVAPLLAIFTYFSVDFLIREKPRRAQAGQAYPLVAKSNCRFSSGECSIENASFRSTLKVERNTGRLLLTTSHPLQSATVGFISADGVESLPSEMTALDKQHNLWQLPLPSNTNSESVARIALRVNDVLYFAETSMQFINYKTTFDRDFRENN